MIPVTAVMPPLTQPLRDEHRELLPRVEELRTVADAVGSAPGDALRRGVEEVYAFLTRHLIPHAHAEDVALYPVVGEVLGAPEATRTMSRDHVEIGRLTEELAGLRSRLAGPVFDDAQSRTLRRVLYGLYALVKVHFAKEEEIYLPLLDARLDPDRAGRMFEAMEAAARAAQGS